LRFPDENFVIITHFPIPFLLYSPSKCHWLKGGTPQPFTLNIEPAWWLTESVENCETSHTCFKLYSLCLLCETPCKVFLCLWHLTTFVVSNAMTS
jgi:hypothetical protein